jgi:hypothetical protein
MFKDWTSVLLALGAALILGALGLVLERAVFLATAERAQGEVIGVDAIDSRCGPRRRKRDCTQYHATVRYVGAGVAHVLSVRAGSATGHGQSTLRARYRTGDSTLIVFSRRNPARTYQDPGLSDGIWRAPFLFFLLAVLPVAGALAERRRRRKRAAESEAGR